MPRSKYALFLWLLAITGCSCAQTAKVLDPQAAVTAGDLTALISGCGQQVTVGYLVCRMPEGSAASEFIAIHSPPNVTCDGEACLYFRIYFPDGRPTFEGKVKKGESFTQVKWDEIINKKSFDLGDRGFYGVSVTLHYTGPDGLPMKSYTDGYLFLHVVKKEYTSLIENEENENYVWIWKAPTNQTIKLTTGFRAYVSPPALQNGSWAK